ncbi:hypothetical protein FRUB_08563 [Fimbriiglobus ruber]|uniref:Tetratricopeptide repeat protein n=1 Tax=Fimbriiglobus ruber TaxID=1908690 RepID=A0A225D329_9BACT|nr:hypothetical protein FRUB_08563 [Fimbriiglobus ruber]
MREVDRQTVWLTAREEFGLRPKDEALGDPVPAGLPADRQIGIRVGQPTRLGPDLTFSVGSTGNEKVIWDRPFRDVTFDKVDPAKTIEQAETISRGRIKECLAAARFLPKANARSAAPVPPEVEKLLGEMRETAQFAAVRLLHDEVRAKGESPALLGALSRAYATLGLLTEFQWSPAPYVFKARSLLYAQRLLARDPKSPTALQYRAYAAALAGLHSLALADLAKAGPTTGQPAWVETIDAFVHFDLGRLAKVQTAADAPLVRLLTYIAKEEPETEAAMAIAGREFFKTEPECYRVHEALGRLTGVSTGHQVLAASHEAFAAGFTQRIREQPGLPKAVADLVTGDRMTPEAEADVYDALRAAGKPSLDRGEPSWTALGSLLRDVRLSLAWQRLYFMADRLAVPTADAARQYAVILAGHPFMPVIESFTVDRHRDPAGFKSKLETVPYQNIDTRSGWFSVWCNSADPTHRMSEMSRRQNGWAYQDLARWLYASGDQDNFRSRRAPQLGRISPHSPIASGMLASFVATGTEPAADAAKLAEIEKKFPDSAMVQRRLAQRHQADGRVEDAERCYRRWVKLSPDGRAYRELAAVYAKLGREDQWKKALEDSLKEEDFGLDHAQTRVQLARFYMAKKDFKQAEPYALEAAESYAQWALLCAAECEVGLEKWDEANALYRANAGRYTGGALTWYFTCRQTGRMQRTAAEEAVTEYLATFEGRIPPNVAWQAGRFYLLSGKTKLAREQFAVEFARRPSSLAGLFAALTADATKDVKERDRILDEMAKLNDDYIKKLAATIQKWTAAKEVPDAKAIDALLAGRHPGEQSDVGMLIAWWLDNRGATERAVELWEKCAAIKVGTLWMRIHTVGFLEDHGIKAKP